MIKELLVHLAILDPMVGPVEPCCGWFDDLYLPGMDDSLYSVEVADR